ncbi:MAG: cob(I)yrinic acid a,c-diamide adenosyltransferase [Proteobacteria bacterium]|nr:cob(I)yrinic acid a,c-diamide adenosyltransferase [Desulfobulbaceae bacterium]MBU4152651.1 cob(I)yrinic acid a,c-diamide adenosyltransferase [Pseudomonadota bacterium]
MARHALTILYTGRGKGKTTAALGQVLRAAGHGFKICVIQFIKGKSTGESNACASLDMVDFHVMGSGFTWRQDPDETKRAAEAGWSLAEKMINAGQHDLVVLDEVTYLVEHQLIAEDRILKLIRERPSHVHLVLTGRDASQKLIDQADLVTEMIEVKHPYAAGVKAQQGIEF